MSLGILSSFLAKEGGTYYHWCPGCEELHAIDVDTPNAHTGARWQFNGDIYNPSFSPSIHRIGTCHYFIRHDAAGKSVIDYLADCTHSLAGKTIPFPVLPLSDEDMLNCNF